MFRAQSALKRNAQSSPQLPYVAELEPLYRMGYKPRSGELIMVAGRSGNMKSTFVLWWLQRLHLPTLYFSADMSAFQASTKLASYQLQKTVDQVALDMQVEPDGSFTDPGAAEHVLERLSKSPIHFSFGTPIRQNAMVEEINAWVDLYNAYPSVIVVDNLMDMEGCEVGYEEQSLAMQALSNLSRQTGATIFVLHHATDKGEKAKADPFAPPPRSEIKNGLSEKAEQVLTVAIDNRDNTFKVAIVKQRMGYTDASAQNFAVMSVNPDKNIFWDPQGPLPDRGEA